MFIIVRHGNTFESGEEPRRIGARTDLPLTDAGLRQAHALAVHFSVMGLHFDRALVSPLLRTRQTAQAILDMQADAPPALPCDWLREIDHGPDENMPESLVTARIGAEAIEAWDRSATPPPGWTVNAEDRIAGWRDLFAADEGVTLLVTSNGAARYALMADTSLQVPNGMKLRTGAYGIVRKVEDGSLIVDEWDRRP